MEELVGEYTKNLSKGGIFLKTDKLLDPNAEIELTLTFPDGKGDFLVRGRVKRLMSMSHPEDPDRQIYGVGIQFVAPDLKMIEAIEEIMDAQDPGSRG